MCDVRRKKRLSAKPMPMKGRTIQKTHRWNVVSVYDSAAIRRFTYPGGAGGEPSTHDGACNSPDQPCQRDNAHSLATVSQRQQINN